jgi:RNA-directed DNA polymerase
MTRQKSEDCKVPKSRRKAASTWGDERPRGGTAVPVNEQAWQLGLPFGTAENGDAQAKPPVGVAARDRSRAAAFAGPKPRSKNRKVTSATMEEVTERLSEAFRSVASNKGAPGPDRQSIEQVKACWDELEVELTVALLEGTYRPGDIRRVWIPKAGGGQRGLGIPNVIDRVVQEAVRRVLEPLYEPTFHPNSHGFRPLRGCHTAIQQARGYLEEGYEWVVDLDLEKFFDQVHHQRLMARLARRVDDRRLLVLIGQMLRAKVVMPDGVKVSTEQGVPQGGPLSPLLSNIVLDELDTELARRGHRFVRYADDCNVYVRSKRAGQRVMASLTSFIDRRLRLKVNANKSAVARPEERHFLGFSLRCEPLEGDVEVLLSKRSKERLAAKLKELTPRTWGHSLKACIAGVNGYLLGWLSHFGICTAGAERTMRNMDAHIRRRLRAIQLKHWRRKRSVAKKLTKLGVSRKIAWRGVYRGHQSWWALSRSQAVHRGLRNAYFADRGLVSLAEQWRARTQPIAAPAQLRLALGYGEVVTRPATVGTFRGKSVVPKSRM